MNKQERIKDLEENIRVYEKRLEDDRDELKRVKDAKEMTVATLIKDWELKREYMTVSKTQGKYEHILGGDGRSRPWSEPRNGTILSIRIKKTVYVSKEDLQKFREYIKATNEERIDKFDIE